MLDAELDTLLIAPDVELDDRIIPAARCARRRRGPGRPPLVTDAEPLCRALAPVLLRDTDEHHRLRAAPPGSGTCSRGCRGTARTTSGAGTPRRCRKPRRCRLAAPTPGGTAALRLRDATPIGCGRSTSTPHRSQRFGWAGYGDESAPSRGSRGAQLLPIATPHGTVTGVGPAHPNRAGQRDQTRPTLTHRPVNRPAPGITVLTDKGRSGAAVDQFFPGLGLSRRRPARRAETTPRPLPNWLRQRIAAILWTVKKPRGLEQHNARVPAGRWTRGWQRLLALNAVSWHNWTIGAPVKRSLIADDH